MPGRSSGPGPPVFFQGGGIARSARYDKPWFAARKFARVPGEDRAFVCATQIQCDPPATYEIQLLEVRTDWVQQEEISTLTRVVASGTLTDLDIVQGCQVKQAPDGGVWVSWWEGVGGVSRIKARRYDLTSRDFGPVTDASGPFVAPKDAVASADCGRRALKGHIRYSPFPSMDLDPVDGRIYIAYAAADTVSPYRSRSVAHLRCPLHGWRSDLNPMAGRRLRPGRPFHAGTGRQRFPHRAGDVVRSA
ncbi:MAG: hypothetical protein N3C12_02240 [Candidatus Binatia bacterium]|nr:hypothetical protein [Candidatus Binatia bacterium]